MTGNQGLMTTTERRVHLHITHPRQQNNQEDIFSTASFAPIALHSVPSSLLRLYHFISQSRHARCSQPEAVSFRFRRFAGLSIKKRFPSGFMLPLLLLQLTPSAVARLLPAATAATKDADAADDAAAFLLPDSSPEVGPLAGSLGRSDAAFVAGLPSFSFPAPWTGAGAGAAAFAAETTAATEAAAAEAATAEADADTATALAFSLSLAFFPLWDDDLREYPNLDALVEDFPEALSAPSEDFGVLCRADMCTRNPNTRGTYAELGGSGSGTKLLNVIRNK